jgi:Protein of unknown function (DUF3995)
VSAYWALGGTALLDTVGGEIERWGRERSADVVVTLWVIVVLKLVGAAAPLVFVGVGAAHLPAWTRGRLARVVGWIAAIGLTLYGGVLSIAGLLVQAGVLDATDDADERALAWHAYLWDPWFALWGRGIRRGHVAKSPAGVRVGRPRRTQQSSPFRGVHSVRRCATHAVRARVRSGNGRTFGAGIRGVRPCWSAARSQPTEPG